MSDPCAPGGTCLDCNAPEAEIDYESTCPACGQENYQASPTTSSLKVECECGHEYSAFDAQSEGERE